MLNVKDLNVGQPLYYHNQSRNIITKYEIRHIAETYIEMYSICDINADGTDGVKDFGVMRIGLFQGKVFTSNLYESLLAATDAKLEYSKHEKERYLMSMCDMRSLIEFALMHDLRQPNNVIKREAFIQRASELTGFNFSDYL